MGEPINETYAAYREKHGLPSLAFLKKHFEFCETQDPHLLGRDIIKKAMERLEFFGKLLEEILQPEANFQGLYESEFFSDDEKQHALQAYKRVMAIYKHALELLITSTEDEEAAFIRQTCKEWENIQKDILPFAQKMTASWKNNKQKATEKALYLG